MRLDDLTDVVGAPRPAFGGDREVREVTRDSRRNGPATAFFAVRGERVDGHDHVSSYTGVAAFVERPVPAPPQLPVCLVPDTRRALALAAAAVAGHPTRRVPALGVTGTNGKTTVTTLIQQAAAHLGQVVGRVGTTGATAGPRAWELGFTTPEAPVLQAVLADMVSAGATALTMEVSSIGLALRRVDGIAFHGAIYTNLSRDHLDFHGDMAAYGAAKMRLFDELLRPAGGLPRALICTEAAAERPAIADVWTYGTSPDADLRLAACQATGDGLDLQVVTPEGTVEIQSRLLGHHNALNLVAALGGLAMLGTSFADGARALASASGPPGRLTRVASLRGPRVVVDYAHSPDALEHALRTLRPLAVGQLWVVFGCGGDRDAGKRAAMGVVARRLADRVVLTSDNPRSEDPASILDAIAQGAGPHAMCIVDRAAAIATAVAGAGAEDVVVIAGKGHERTQEIAGVHHPFDDHQVASDALAVWGLP